MRQDMASRLFALDGAEVVEVDAEAGGSRTGWVRPGPAGGGVPGLRDGIGAREGVCDHAPGGSWLRLDRTRFGGHPA